MFSDQKNAVRKLARILRAVRKQLDCSQIEMSKVLGVSQGSLSKIEAELLTLTPEQWYHFCEFANISPDQAWYSGCVDRCDPKELQNGLKEGAFRIPPRYAYLRGSKVRSIRFILNYFNQVMGEKKLSAYLKKQEIDEDFFVILDNQLNADFSLELLRMLIRSGSLKRVNIPVLAEPFRLPDFHGALASRYELASSRSHRLVHLIEASKNYDVNCNYHIEQIHDHYLDISVTPREHFNHFSYKDDTLGDFLCQYKKEAIKSFSQFGEAPNTASKPVSIEELECHFRGHSSKCVYRLKVAS